MMPDYDESTVQYAKHRRSEVNNGVTEEVSEEVPKLPDTTTAKQILSFLSTFANVRRNLQWTTGPRLFQKFPMH